MMSCLRMCGEFTGLVEGGVVNFVYFCCYIFDI